MSWGAKIQKLLDERNIDHVDIAKKINVTASNISQICSKTHPPLKKVEAICRVLNIPLWRFFLEDESELENALPSWIDDKDIEIIKMMKNDVCEDHRLIILAGIRSSLAVALKFHKEGK